jgi:NAD(P)H-flavin reductase
MYMVTSDPMLPVPWTLKNVRHDTADTFTMDLVPAGASQGMSFAPGQFNMLYAFGAGEVPVSISGDSADPARLTHTVRAVGAVTRSIQKLKRGDRLGVRGPFGCGWPVETAAGKNVVLVAGGIGLAPLRSAVYHVFRNRQRYRNVSLLYGARTQRDLLYRHELERWRARFDCDVDVTLDTATREWGGHVGVVTSLIPRLQSDPRESVAMMCGPETMMRFTVAALKERGFQEQDIYLSIERNMKCAVGFCGHCQFGPQFICKDGPVFRFDRISYLFAKREV